MTTESAARAGELRAARGARLRRGVELLVDRAARARSPHAFLEEALAIVGAAFESIHAALEARHGSIVVHETYDAGQGPPVLWEGCVQDFLTETLADATRRVRVFRGTEASHRLALLASPLGGESGSVSGAIALVVPCEREADVEHELAMLEAMCALAARLAESAGRTSVRSTEGEANAVCKVADFASSAELALAIADRLRARGACERAAVGRVRGRRVRVIAVSGADAPARSATAVRRMEAAMGECLDAGRAIVDQGDACALDRDVPRDYRLHAAWRADADGAPVASIPIFARDACVAVVSLSRSSGRGFVADEFDEIADLVAPYAAAFELVDRAHRSLASHAIAASRSSVARMTSGSWTRRLTALALAAAMVGVATRPVEQELAVAASIVPVDARQVAAPMDGVLRAVRARPGDRVHVGNVLFELDAAPLELELERAKGELAEAELSDGRAIASGDAFDRKLARMRVKQSRASVELLERAVANAVVTAPSSGLVSGRYLADRVGTPVAKGDLLCEISSEGRWLVELRIPERAFDAVRAGVAATLEVRGDHYRAQVVSVEPTARRIDGENVFVALASTDAEAPWIHAGTSGVALISLGERPAWRALVERLADWTQPHRRAGA